MRELRLLHAKAISLSIEVLSRRRCADAGEATALELLLETRVRRRLLVD